MSTQGSSHWQPYFNLVPASQSNPPPMLWSPEEREQLLRGTGVCELVEDDLQRSRQDYRNIGLPFMQRHQELYGSMGNHNSKLFHKGSAIFRIQLFKFKSNLSLLNNYCKWAECQPFLSYFQSFSAVAFVMSYSFTDLSNDPLSQTMMVPFVDLLNHHSKHHVELSFDPTHLKLVAVRNIGEVSPHLASILVFHVWGSGMIANAHYLKIASDEYFSCRCIVMHTYLH